MFAACRKKGIAVLGTALLAGAMALPVQAEAAEVFGRLYIPEDQQVTMQTSGGIGFDFSKEKKSKPTAAEFWLIDANVNWKNVPGSQVDDWYRSRKIPVGQHIYYTKAADDGTFDLKDVAGGDYYLVIVNNYVPGRGGDPDALKALQGYMPDYEMFQLFITGMSDPTVIRFHVKADERASFDTMPSKQAPTNPHED